MKLAETNAVVTGDLELDTYKMGLDPDSIKLIIDALTSGLYSDPYTAVLREYTSNAVDAHEAAGQTRPVEVSLPTRLSPSLIIEDWGLGMDRADLINYSQYGFSDKRDSNSMIGGFGLGSKSALAISSQFTVAAVKNGRKNVAVISMGTDGPEGGFMDETLTDEPNGVKITIPTSEVYKFRQAIESGMFQGFRQGSIRVDGIEPASIHGNDSYREILDEDGVTILGWHHTQKVGNHTGTYAFVGPVRYWMNWEKVSLDVSRSLLYGYLAEVIFNLPNGEVEIPRNRETLTYNARTRRTITKVVERVVATAKKVYEDQVDSAPTYRDAVKLKLNAESNGFTGTYTYKGEEIKIEAPKGDPLGNINLNRVTKAMPYNRGGKSIYDRSGRQLQDYYGTGYLGNIVNVPSVLVHTAGEVSYGGSNYGLHVISSLTSMYARSREAAGDKFSGTNFYFTSLTPAAIGKSFVNLFSEVIPASDFEARGKEYRREQARQARKGRSTTRTKPQDGVVRVLDYRPNGTTVSTLTTLGALDTTKKYILLHSGADTLTDRLLRVLTTNVGFHEDPNFAKALTPFMTSGGYTVLTANKGWKVEDYAKVLPNLTPFTTALAEYVKTLKVSSTPMEDRATQDMAKNVGRWAFSFKAEQIDKINRASTRDWMLGMKSTVVVENRKWVGDLINLGLYTPTKPATSSAALPESPSVRYPLLGELWSLSGKSLGYAIDYINLMDAHLTAQGKP